MDKVVQHNGVICTFVENSHTYTLNTGQILTSVTQTIGQITPPFNSREMAKQVIDKKKPAYLGMNIDQVIKQWEDKAALASMEGTELHSLLERWPEKGCFGWLPKTYRLLKMGKQVEKLFPKLLERFRLIAAEKLVFSPSMGIAGMVDLIMADDDAQQGILIDWKTNNKITDEESAFGNMLPPIDHLKNCDTVKYGLQLGLYEKVLVDEKYYSEFKGYRKVLMHVRESFGKVVKVNNYSDEVEKILEICNL